MKVIVVVGIVVRPQHGAKTLAGTTFDHAQELAFPVAPPIPARPDGDAASSTNPETSIAAPVEWAERRVDPATLRHE